MGAIGAGRGRGGGRNGDGGSEEATGGHEFILDLDPESAQLAGDPDQISQIFWNLARNALRAMPKGGQLFIRGRLSGETYSIEFRDTGHGMSAEQRAKLFHPFQSFFDSGNGNRHGHRLPHRPGARRLDQRREPACGRHPDRRRSARPQPRCTARRVGGLSALWKHPDRRRRDEPARVPLRALLGEGLAVTTARSFARRGRGSRSALPTSCSAT